jgi:UDP-N-acetylglucosamine 2-epimerase (non-hydrolysing)
MPAMNRQKAPMLHVVGARPNFMKAAPVVHALDALGARQLLVHTGQHYDAAMSDVFISQLGLEPDVNLGVGSGSHAQQTAAIMQAFEEVVVATPPSVVVVYGDVNSTIAAALVAAKLRIPVAHVEAGLRSFDREMPEEINRILTDHLSRSLFVTAPEGIENLAAEGITGGGVHLVGNPMIDTLLSNLDTFDSAASQAEVGVEAPYAVATVHRPSNVDDPAAAWQIVTMLQRVAEVVPVVLALHPRGRTNLEREGLQASNRLIISGPLGYREFMALVRGAAFVVTDSGGIQEETTMLDVPCLTIRENTERPVTITHGTNRLIRPTEVPAAAADITAGRWSSPSERPPLWDGHAGPRIARILVESAP